MSTNSQTLEIGQLTAITDWGKSQELQSEDPGSKHALEAEYAAAEAMYQRLLELQDAIDLASDQNQATWLTDNGKRIAMIVPVDAGEEYERSWQV